MKYSATVMQFSYILCLFLTMGIQSAHAANNGETIIELTQTGCQFLEPEGKDHKFQTASADDCITINRSSGDKRLEGVKLLKLKPGKYIFRVKNKNVPYLLGFWLRGVGLQRILLPSVSGGGIVTGGSQDYQVILKPGKYLYSCPLNPTPDYPLIVEE